MDTIGWIGSILLAVCALPQAFKSWKDGHSRGLSWGLLILWLGGEILTLLYVFPKADWPLIFNYTCNILLIGIMLKYKIHERNRQIK